MIFAAVRIHSTTSEYSAHVDDPALVDGFFRTLQAQFLEVFHPLLITARLYRRS